MQLQVCRIAELKCESVESGAKLNRDFDSRQVIVYLFNMELHGLDPAFLLGNQSCKADTQKVHERSSSCFFQGHSMSMRSVPENSLNGARNFINGARKVTEMVP